MPDVSTILHFMEFGVCPFVTAKMATPAKVDSKLSDAHLESLERATEALEGFGVEGGMPQRPRVESSAVRLHKRFYLASTGQTSILFILHSSKHM